jgi:large subunit ribosomal protein L22
MADKPQKPNILVRASARNLRIAPRKMRLVTNLVRNMRVADAMTQLQFTNKKGAKMLQKLLQSAVANAEHNFSLNREGLFVKSITCDMGPVMQRSFPRARGSAFIIRRKLAHVNLVLEERPIKGKKKSVVPAKAKKIKEIDEAKPEPEKVTSEIPDKKVKEKHFENQASNVDSKNTSDIFK